MLKFSSLPCGAALASVLLLAGCAGVEVQNRQAAQELEQRSKPPGSVYTGWRVFQDRCAGCHGPAATGTAGGGPDLLPRVREMGSHRFVRLVLKRYDWGLPHPGPGSSGVVVRRAGAALSRTPLAPRQRQIERGGVSYACRVQATLARRCR